MSFLAERFRRLGIFLLDSLVCGKRKSATNDNTILVVRLDAIGDFVLWVEAAKQLRELYPKPRYHLTLLGNVAWSDLAENLNSFDRIISVSRGRFLREIRYRASILKKIRNIGFETAIYPAFSREFLCGDTIIRACGSKERIGFVGDHSNITPWLKRISDRWYTRLIRTENDNGVEIVRNSQFMASLGAQGAMAKKPVMNIPKSWSPAELRDIPYVVLFPGASWAGRRWPADRFVQIARRIFHRTGWTALICGGAEEAALADRFVQHDFPVQNWIGRTSIKELAGIIAGARMVITNETSATHLAIAMNVPVVCLLGGGDYGRFLPLPADEGEPKSRIVTVSHQMPCFGCRWKCIYEVADGEPVPCIQNISLETAWTEIDRLMQIDASRHE
jgi:ADP-heptose:LPS heptosyltransferase